MSRRLHDLPDLSLPHEVEIARVQSQPDQASWLHVLMKGLEGPEPSRPDFQQYLANSLDESAPVFEHFLARWDGVPCVVLTLLRADHAAGIDHVTTLPVCRGYGVGTALTLAAMRSARKFGPKEAVLFATPSGFPIYERLGFVTVTTADAFIWGANE